MQHLRQSCVGNQKHILFVSLKVVHNVGLCIALWDILKLEDSYIFPGDGSYHTVGMYATYCPVRYSEIGDGSYHTEGYVP